MSSRHHSFSELASNLACTLAHSRPLWRFMFFSKRAFNTLSSSSACSDDNFFLLLFMLLILLYYLEFTNPPIPFHQEFAACIFQSLLPRIWISWLQKNKAGILFAFPVLIH